jgi:hypothetical protein
MKNESTSSAKGKPWGKLTGACGEGYRQESSGGGAGGTPSGKFLGATKGNRDLVPNRSAGVSTGHGGGPHKAGG